MTISPALIAGPQLDRWREKQSAHQVVDDQVLRNVAYGPHPEQTLDIYLSERSNRGAPVIFMVHGGAWKIGDKGHSKVVENKIRRWLPKGFVFISVNYPMLPEADPLSQANHVAKALAYAQSQADQWGADGSRFILMGHSAGAHLVALLDADPDKARARGARPWLGTIALDSAAMDVEQIMQNRHYRFYDEAFGRDRAYWRRASPIHVLQSNAAPLLMVCSSRRSESCDQAQAFSRQAKSIGVSARVLPEDLSHGQINGELGLPGRYTEQVEAFMASLHPQVQSLLSAGPP